MEKSACIINERAQREAAKAVAHLTKFVGVFSLSTSQSMIYCTRGLQNIQYSKLNIQVLKKCDKNMLWSEERHR